ncbi:MAG: GDP-L-fucose synthase [Candidatus Moraniibacteriota bacterium]|nr:MAG: GDP-L-fucose synthase [Candidatus Moranbacteria bacterium]
MEKKAKIFVAGHTGLVGSSIVRRLKKENYKNIILLTKEELDLLDQHAVHNFFQKETPEYVFLSAAKVGGILANKQYKADFIYENLQIQNNIIHSSWKSGVKKLLFLGSSCIYPKLSPQPIKEEYLLTGLLEETNDAYAIAKIAGIKMCQSFNEQYNTKFISVMPTNLYGPGDNFDKETSHVLPAMIRKFHEAKVNNKKEVILWGTGTPKREFLYVDDLADALVFLMNTYENSEIVNIGTGKDLSIKELAKTIKGVVNFSGKIIWDTEKPNGTPRKLLNVSRLHKIGWKHSIELEEGIQRTYEWFRKSYGK